MYLCVLKLVRRQIYFCCLHWCWTFTSDSYFISYGTYIFNYFFSNCHSLLKSVEQVLTYFFQRKIYYWSNRKMYSRYMANSGYWWKAYKTCVECADSRGRCFEAILEAQGNVLRIDGANNVCTYEWSNGHTDAQFWSIEVKSGSVWKWDTRTILMISLEQVWVKSFALQQSSL